MHTTLDQINEYFLELAKAVQAFGESIEHALIRAGLARKVVRMHRSTRKWRMQAKGHSRTIQIRLRVRLKGRGKKDRRNHAK